MSLREVLQIELWSKQTTRKILVALKWIGIGIGTALTGIVLWFSVWTHWLTASERNAGREALAQVEVLEKYEGASDTEFGLEARLAQEKVFAANSSITTAKDRQVALLLEIYLDELQQIREMGQMPERLRSKPDYKTSEQSRKLASNIEISQR